VRLVSARRGIDPSGYTIVAYGGGGPLHGAMVAEELGMHEVLVPWAPGLSSAFGLLIADTMIDVAQSDIHPLGEGSLDADRLRALAARAAEGAAQNGLAEADYSVSIGLDMRYAGQAFELTVWTGGHPTSPAALRALFEDEHRTRYGYARAKLSVEVVGYRIRVIRANEARIETPLPSGDGPRAETVPLTLAGHEFAATLVSREAMRPGTRLAGPAIIAEATSTTFVPPDWDADVLPSGDLMLRRRP
jgi:N-methylhydantoinase A